MNKFNLHTHSNFCDGTGEPEEYIRSAIRKNLHTLGFSSHAPVPFTNTFAIKNDDELGNYCREIRRLQAKYAGMISVHLALEIDYIEGIRNDFSELKHSCGLDYTIGSVHLVRNGTDEKLWFIDGPRIEQYDNGLNAVFQGDIRRAVRAYYEQVAAMITTQKPDIIGHFDKIKMNNKNRYFREDEPWYRELVLGLVDVIERSGVIVEVNSRGIYKKRSDDLYPGQWILKILKERHIPVTISADAHHPDEIDANFDDTAKILKEIGYKSLVCYNNNGWQELPI